MILEAIFNGEIYPAETVVPKSEKFREAGQAIADTMRYFEQTLSKEDYAKLDKLNDHLQTARPCRPKNISSMVFQWVFC